MYGTYSESVHDFTDHHGNLSRADATRLLADHGFTWSDVYADHHGVSWANL